MVKNPLIELACPNCGGSVEASTCLYCFSTFLALHADSLQAPKKHRNSCSDWIRWHDGFATMCHDDNVPLGTKMLDPLTGMVHYK